MSRSLGRSASALLERLWGHAETACCAQQTEDRITSDHRTATVGCGRLNEGGDGTVNGYVLGNTGLPASWACRLSPPLGSVASTHVATHHGVKGRRSDAGFRRRRSADLCCRQSSMVSRTRCHHGAWVDACEAGRTGGRSGANHPLPATGWGVSLSASFTQPPPVAR